ncbi:RAD protein (Pv-fam-e) [Caenorhabditis elegans]|uniref:RAD protein (Pv-fam-e) n=1 Tax=Caenorhabditis elegans TaxID=6239 RepID=D0IN07_CAEEL|nr:RAD protein (Pv-fam-e) [Caenorhabditis elegans]CBH29671.2 RAD protein (Pv-fam-e) [Caenorhabditis elegans]|eukprot:NP_001346702.1 Uncharacterized protein CELE_Y43F8B.23 [Caenorhabditis elegans]
MDEKDQGDSKKYSKEFRAKGGGRGMATNFSEKMADTEVMPHGISSFKSKRENQNDTEWNLKEKCSESEVQNNPMCMEKCPDISEIKTTMDKNNSIGDLEEDSTDLTTTSHLYPVEWRPLPASSSMENYQIGNNENAVDCVNDIEKGWKKLEEIKKEEAEGVSEINDYRNLLKNAKEASDNFEIVEFSKCFWKTVSSFTNAFYQENFKYSVNDNNLKQMYEKLCVGLDGSEAAFIMRSWD